MSKSKFQRFPPFFTNFLCFWIFWEKKIYKWLPLTPPKMSKKIFFKKSKNTENWWKKGENFRILTSSKSKKFKFYILDIVYEKKFGGYFLKKTPFSIFKGLLGPIPKNFFQGPNTYQSAYLKPWLKKSYLREFVF